MKRDTDNKVTLEDLLRLKRAERPAAEFWERFESEIRSKQLSAIVSKRPWWDRFSKVFAVVNRHQLSFGAAAALAMAFAGFRYVGGQHEAPRALQVTASSHLAVAAAVPVPAPAAPAVFSAPERREAIVAAVRTSAPAPQTMVSEAASHRTQAPAAVVSDSFSKSAFADGVAIKLADFREPMSDYARPSVFGSDREFEPSVTTVHQAASEPLARMDPAAERRARLLAPALPAYSSGGQGSLAGDWMKQRASWDDRMYESMDRGPSDDRTLVGFRF